METDLLKKPNIKDFKLIIKNQVMPKIDCISSWNFKFHFLVPFQSLHLLRPLFAILYNISHMYTRTSALNTINVDASIINDGARACTQIATSHLARVRCWRGYYHNIHTRTSRARALACACVNGLFSRQHATWCTAQDHTQQQQQERRVSGMMAASQPVGRVA